MTPVYLFHRSATSMHWIVSRVTVEGQEPLFCCRNAREARALTRALRELAGSDPQAKYAALRELGLSRDMQDALQDAIARPIQAAVV